LLSQVFSRHAAKSFCTILLLVLSAESDTAVDMTTTDIDSTSASALPASLTSKGLKLRPETDDDLPFLRHVYATTRAEELAATGWSEAQKLAFTDSQFDLQRHHYRTYYPATEWDVLEKNETPIGRLYLQRRITTHLVIDIALLPEWRGRGLGTALMEWVCAQASAVGKSVTVTVEKFNRAQTLYRRLGFREIAEGGVYWEMEWGSPPNSAPVN
jgi:GNAT superfamily N-acetyltransferase